MQFKMPSQDELVLFIALTHQMDHIRITHEDVVNTLQIGRQQSGQINRLQKFTQVIAKAKGVTLTEEEVLAKMEEETSVQSDPLANPLNNPYAV